MERLLSLTLVAADRLMGLLHDGELGCMWFVSRRARFYAAREKARREDLELTLAEDLGAAPPPPGMRDYLECAGLSDCPIFGIPSPGSCDEALSLLPKGRELLRAEEDINRSLALTPFCPIDLDPTLRTAFVDAARCGNTRLLRLFASRTRGKPLFSAACAAAGQGNAGMMAALIDMWEEDVPREDRIFSSWATAGFGSGFRRSLTSASQETLLAAALCGGDRRCIEIAESFVLSPQSMKAILAIKYHRNDIARRILELPQVRFKVDAIASEKTLLRTALSSSNIEMMRLICAKIIARHGHLSGHTDGILYAANPTALRVFLEDICRDLSSFNVSGSFIEMAQRMSKSDRDRVMGRECLRIVLQHPTRVYMSAHSMESVMAMMLASGDLDIVRTLLARGALLTTDCYIEAGRNPAAIEFLAHEVEIHDTEVVRCVMDRYQSVLLEPAMLRFLLNCLVAGLGGPLSQERMMDWARSAIKNRITPHVVIGFISVLCEFGFKVTSELTNLATVYRRCNLLRVMMDEGYPVRLHACKNVARHSMKPPCEEIVRLIEQRQREQQRAYERQRDIEQQIQLALAAPDVGDAESDTPPSEPDRSISDP